MTQLSVAMLALQKDSKFFKKYQARPKVENLENLLFWLDMGHVEPIQSFFPLRGMTYHANKKA